MDFVKELGRRLVTITGEKREATFLTQKISLAIQRGNAMTCQGTLPATLTSADD